MAARRYYFSDSITDFLSRSNNEIIGALTLASQHDVNDETSKSWVEEIGTMREEESRDFDPLKMADVIIMYGIKTL